MTNASKGGRPKADPRAVQAWKMHRRKAVPIKPLADLLGVSQPAISKWTQVPADRLAQVANYLGVGAYDLRPDLDPFSALTKGN
jgi:DNA-binding transcriptional regulator YdaS (Cro superfamily)